MPTAPRGRGRPRAQLSRAAILEVATAIAARGDAITFRALGAALNADPTAVYRHFRDKDELVCAVFDGLLADVLDRIDESMPWRDQVRAVADLTWRACEAHPSVGVEANVMTTRGPGELASIERMLVILDRAGLSRDDVVRFYAVFSGYILCVGAAIAAYRLQAPEAGDSLSGSWLGDVGPVDPRRYPALAEAAPRLAALDDEEVYMSGIEVMLDAAEAAANASPWPH